MIDLLYYIFFIIPIIGVVLVIIADTGDSGRKLAWLLIIALIPLIGLFLYLAFGINYRKHWYFNKQHSKSISAFNKGYKEVTLLGQNVDSYLWKEEERNVDFADLLEMVAQVSPELRVRFSTSNPQDISDKVIYTMAQYNNICKHIHLPVQSGSDVMLEKMRRRYSREGYLQRVAKIREVLPGCGLSTDVIAGFCSETEEDHKATLSLFEEVCFDSAFMFYYSERPGTLASKKYADDIPIDVKTRRLNEIIELQSKCSLKSNKKDIGKIFRVLIEGTSKKNPDELCGRASNNKMCVFPDKKHKVGDYADVKVISCTSATLLCELI